MVEQWMQEEACRKALGNLGEVYHLWTRENFEIIFTCDDDYKSGMTIMGISARLFSDVKILTFCLMSNHIHIAASGAEDRILSMFEKFKKLLSRKFSHCGRAIKWQDFCPKLRRLESLEDVRNVIIYDNRNGYLVQEDHTPFSYPWGANQYYFNPQAKEYATATAKNMAFRELRTLSGTHDGDKLEGIKSFHGCDLPLVFCDIYAGESLFRSAKQYFERLSRNIEANADIAKEIGERLAYTDDELYAAISKISRKKYGSSQPSLVSAVDKVELAKTMRFDYNASSKQICRILKIDGPALKSIFSH